MCASSDTYWLGSKGLFPLLFPSKDSSPKCFLVPCLSDLGKSLNPSAPLSTHQARAPVSSPERALQLKAACDSMSARLPPHVEWESNIQKRHSRVVDFAQDSTTIYGGPVIPKAPGRGFWRAGTSTPPRASRTSSLPLRGTPAQRQVTPYVCAALSACLSFRTTMNGCL